MHTTGLIFTIFGGLFLFGSVMALAMIDGEEKTKKSDLIDIFLLGGMITLTRNVIMSIIEGFRDRRSDAFPPLIIFGISVFLLLCGSIMMSIGGSQRPDKSIKKKPNNKGTSNGG